MKDIPSAIEGHSIKIILRSGLTIEGTCTLAGNQYIVILVEAESFSDELRAYHTFHTSRFVVETKDVVAIGFVNSEYEDIKKQWWALSQHYQI